MHICSRALYVYVHTYTVYMHILAVYTLKHQELESISTRLKNEKWYKGTKQINVVDTTGPMRITTSKAPEDSAGSSGTQA